ncbi:MAG: FadR family transcriptional regulator [Proteobacteria bacterium]|nr:FadR family transcriptional regulator [Pseudomonadota bacterium]
MSPRVPSHLGAFHRVAPPPRVRLSDAVGEQIERLIVDGVLPPGEVLPAERELSRRLHVSRPSLREALLKLEARGLLRAGRGGSLAVTDVAAPTITDPLVHLLLRHEKAARDVQDVRHGLEALAAWHAAQNATAADLRKLRRIFASMTPGRGRRDALVDAQADTEFHMAIADASKNVALMHIAHGIANLVRTSSFRIRDMLYHRSENIPILHEQHAAILDAIADRDPERARTAAQLHFSFIESSLRGLGARPLPAAAAPRTAGRPRDRAARRAAAGTGRSRAQRD